MKKRIFVLGLGGTISSLPDTNNHEFYHAPTIDIQKIIDQLPPFKEPVEIISEQAAQKISHDFDDNDLIVIAKKINSLIKSNKYSGIVVTQGTNSIEEVAYFINVTIQTNIPVVFTGSLRPSTSLGFDGIRNLHNAILLAKSNKSEGKGVLVTFNDCIYSARDVIKINPSILNAFSGNEFALMGYIRGETIYFYASHSYKHTCSSDFNINGIDLLPKVAIIYGHLGMDPIFIDTAIEYKFKGIISAGLGNGYQSVIINKALIRAKEQGIVIVRCSRTNQGITSRDPNIDDKYNFIAAGTTSIPKARILLSLALTKTADLKIIQKYFLEY